MKIFLFAFLCLTAIIPELFALTITSRAGAQEDSAARIQEAGAAEAAELDSEQSDFYNVANQVHARITEVTNDTRGDHQLIRMHWTADSEIWVRAFKLRFTYFDDKLKTIKTESRWMFCPNEDGSFNMIPPHAPIDEWHELSLPSDAAGKLKSVTVAVDVAYESD